MDKVKRDRAIVREREQKHTTFAELGAKQTPKITPSRAHQIYHDKRDFYSRLSSHGSISNRVRRIVLTKEQVAERLNIPEAKLELRV